MNTIRLLILTPNPIESASTRYRISQYLPHLASAGIIGVVSPFISSDLFREIYRPGLSTRKIMKLMSAIFQRFSIFLKTEEFDAVFISREIMTLGPAIIEWILSHHFRIPIIFDFDDAIWVPYASPTYGSLIKLIKPPSKTAHIISCSKAVIAGNNYLESYARQFNTNVSVIPTVVDTDIFRPDPARPPRQTPIVGWIGSHSTSQYLRLITSVLSELGKRYDYQLRVIGASKEITIDNVMVENRPWNLKSEVDDFAGLDIGLYPIIENEWSIGKCAFKAIQYQAVGVPCVASAVGMTRDVIDSGQTGLLAETADEWFSALELLLNARERRIAIGIAGRDSVCKRYSLQVYAERLTEIVLETAVKYCKRSLR